MHTKKPIKKTGIYMDYASAQVISVEADGKEMHIIDSGYSHSMKAESMAKGENLLHNKTQQLEHQYYKKIGEVILQFEEVLLFGPTDAKIACLKYLQKNSHFNNIKITTASADKITPNQQRAFVNDYFSTPNL
jgi:hypothetical protein